MGPKRFLPERKSYSGLEKFVAGRGINWDEWDEDKHAQEVETEFHRILHVVKFPEAAEDEAAQAADMKRVWHAHAGGFAWPNSNASWEKKVLLVDLWNRLAADFAGTTSVRRESYCQPKFIKRGLYNFKTSRKASQR